MIDVEARRSLPVLVEQMRPKLPTVKPANNTHHTSQNKPRQRGRPAASIINSANLSLFMVNLSQALLAASGNTGILDMKARYHTLQYAQEAFKILPENTQVISFEGWLRKIPVLDRSHCQKMAS